MDNDTPVYHAFAFNPKTVDWDIWVGIGTREAISKRNLRSDGYVMWCPKQWLIDGWRDK